MMTFLARLLTLLALAILTACASNPTTDVSHRAPTQADLLNWSLTGKIGITTASDRINANLDWQQTLDQYRVQLSGPLGQGRVTIDGDPSQITITNKGETLTGSSAQSLLQQQLGWSVPVEHFSYWAKGVISPLVGVTSMEYDDAGALSQIIQAGWTIDFSRYEIIDGWRLPSKLNAKTGQLSLVLVIKDWQPQP